MALDAPVAGIDGSMSAKYQVYSSSFCLPRFLVTFFVCMALTSEAVEVKFKLDHSSVLQFEPVVAFVAIRNDSTKPLILGGKDKPSAGVDFQVKKHNGDPVPILRDKPLIERLVIPPGMTRQAEVVISARHDLRDTGRYSVKAVMNVDGRTLASEPVHLEVVNGLEITSVRKHVVGEPDLIREYSLRYWVRDGRECAFLRVDEPRTGMHYGAFPLGRIIRVVKPHIIVDDLGGVKVIHQSGADRYTWSYLRSLPDKVIMVDQTYHKSDGSSYNQP